MKSIKFLISAVLLFSCMDAFCCLPISYEPKEYYMYRVYDRDSPADGGQKEANCRAYRELTSPDIPMSDIESVVYGYTLEQIGRLSGAKDSSNEFARYIGTVRDAEIVDFLVVAKTCENAGEWMNDSWYYPAKNDTTVAALEEVIEKSLAYSGRRLEDRYVLQAVRAMMSLKRHSAIDSLWRSRGASLRESIVKEMVKGYVAGALLQKGDRSAAFRHFKALGDLKSIRQYWPEYRQSDAIFYFAARECPDSPQVPELLQSIVGHMEEEIINETVHHGQKLDAEAFRVLYSLSQVCLRAASRSTKNAGVWYRASGKRNIFDYSDAFFLALDSMPLQPVKEYERQVGSGKTELDRFLDERGYVDHDYLLEVIGTRHLRRREYKAAVDVLSKVSLSYENRLNVSGYFNRLPFDVGNQISGDYDQYKLSFAKEMLSLETKMRSADPDKAGAAMIKYGTGLCSSFDYCWALTQYSFAYDDEWISSNYRKKALSDGEAYIETGLKTIRTSELAANYYVQFSRFKTAAEKFPQTSAAKEVLGSCDRLVDYSMKSYVNLYQKHE